MLPYIQRLLATIPENGQIFDVGAGAGDVVDFALKDAPKGTTIHLEEPNPHLLQSYVNRVKNYDHLRLGVIYEGCLEDYYRGKKQGKFPHQPQNLILAMHMIYHLTNFATPHIAPEDDLIEAISFLYGLLAPGGSIFIAYADLLKNDKGEAVCGIAEKYFRTFHPQECFADNLISIYEARNTILGPDGSIAAVLGDRFPTTTAQVKSEWRACHFFGESIADIGVLALAAELCSSDNKPFDLRKLQFCFDYISQYPDRIGLQKEEGNVPQKGLWRANEPHVITTITKFA